MTSSQSELEFYLLLDAWSATDALFLLASCNPDKSNRSNSKKFVLTLLGAESPLAVDSESYMEKVQLLRGIEKNLNASDCLDKWATPLMWIDYAMHRGLPQPCTELELRNLKERINAKDFNTEIHPRTENNYRKIIAAYQHLVFSGSGIHHSADAKKAVALFKEKLHQEPIGEKALGEILREGYKLLD